MAPNSYPSLGFNPAPGSQDSIEHLVDMLGKAKAALEEAKQGIVQVSQGNSELWKGKAAEEFRKDLSGKLPGKLDKAMQSIGQAATALSGWKADLAGFQDTASRLDGEAKAAKDKLDGAGQQAATARSSPDLALAGVKADTDTELANLQKRYDDAQLAVSNADKAVNEAKAAYDAIMRRAHELEKTHDDDAKAVAGKLDDADDIAPHKPKKSWWKKFRENAGKIGNYLALASAVVGLAAIVFFSGGAALVPLLALSTALSAGALASHAADPKTWNALKQGPMSGDFWAASMTLAGDAIGAIPGVGIAVRGVNGTVRGAIAATNGAHAIGPFAAAVQAGRNLLPTIGRVGPRVLKDEATWLGTKVADISLDVVNSRRTLPIIGSAADDFRKIAQNTTNGLVAAVGVNQAASDVADDPGWWGSSNNKTAGDAGLNAVNSPGAYDVIKSTIRAVR
ncbi:hypothetical protein [Yinghuangia seranimata]|uniref:hypothetical protein n=1 Tax=Yinghuangia seranimata TaxID=408067 RepID=UPI00248C2A16|nr:hypothetical protein [Yinghuangia seranimata]MDI2130520.1 hypothetical protein [Yinghuangia seranimata]